MPAPLPIARVEFHRTKYGRHLLVDTAWVRDMPTFLLPGPHALTFYDILLVTRGRGWFWLDGHRYRVRPGEVLFTTPGEVRWWQVAGLDGLCLFFPSIFLEEFFSDPHFLLRLPFFHAAKGAASLPLGRRAGALRRRLLGMRREILAYRSDSAHLLRARLYELLITLAREYAESHQLPAPRTPHPVAVRFHQQVIASDPPSHRVADHARELAVSPGHLNLLCRRFLGRSAKEIIQERLAVEARRRLLYTDETAARIGMALGFEDPSYFTRFMHRTTGLAPGRFRAESRLTGPTPRGTP